MGEDEAVAAGLREIDADLRRMIAGEVEPYAAGWNVWGKAFSLAEQSPDLMWPLWLIWGALTDRVECRPEETAQANEMMRRAAREWLALDDDKASRTAYLQRWVYEELGYTRPVDYEGNLTVEEVRSENGWRYRVASEDGSELTEGFVAAELGWRAEFVGADQIIMPVEDALRCAVALPNGNKQWRARRVRFDALVIIMLR